MYIVKAVEEAKDCSPSKTSPDFLFLGIKGIEGVITRGALLSLKERLVTWVLSLPLTISGTGSFPLRKESICSGGIDKKTDAFVR